MIGASRLFPVDGVMEMSHHKTKAGLQNPIENSGHFQTDQSVGSWAPPSAHHGTSGYC